MKIKTKRNTKKITPQNPQLQAQKAHLNPLKLKPFAIIA